MTAAVTYIVENCRKMSKNNEAGIIVTAKDLCYTVSKERGETVATMLIAGASANFCDSFTALIPQQHQVLRCLEVEEMFDALCTVKPDLLVFDMDLSGLDGLFFLENARAAGVCTKFLVMGSLLTEYVQGRLMSLQISHFMKKPCCVQQVATRAVGICMEQEDMMPSPEKVELFLMNIGIYQHLNGYHCLVWGIYSYWLNPYQSFTKELYPYIAEKCDCNWKNVEHAMRSCIHKAYVRRNDSLWRLYFPTGKDGKVAHLTSAKFIACVAGHLRRVHTPEEKVRAIK